VSSNVSTSTRLRSFQGLNFGDFEDYVIEDSDFLESLIARVIEDTELVVYVLAKVWEMETADVGLVARAIEVYGHVKGEVVADFSEDAIVNPERINDRSKLPLKRDDEAVVLFSKFVNLYLFAAIKAAAEKAREEGTQTITRLHFFSWCHLLPFPLNVYLC